MATIQQTFAFLQPEGAGRVTAPTGKFAGSAKLPLSRSEPTGLATVLQPSNIAATEPAASAVGSPSLATVSDPDDRLAVLQRLRTQVGCVSTATPVAAKLSTGCEAIDAMLPSGGLKANAITEWVAESDGSSAAALSLIITATYLRSRSVAGPLLVVDIDKTFYPPAAVALGIPMEQIILVRPQRHADMIWAIDQALRCEAVAAVWAHVGTRLDDRDARRFQLAAETGNTPGFLVRPKAVRGRPSFADVRFHVVGGGVSENVVSRGPRRAPSAQMRSDSFFAPNRLLQVTLDRCRGGVIGQSTWVQIDDQAQIHHVSFTPSVHHETAAVHLASQLANPTAAQPTDQQKRRA